MYQELVKYPDKSKWGSVIYIVWIVLGVFALSVLSWLLSSLGIPWGDLLAVIVAGIWAVNIYKKRIVSYRYSLMDTDLVVTRKVGDREKDLFSLDIASIESIGPEDKELRMPTERFVLPTKKLRVVQVIYMHNGERKRVMLQPSDKLLDLIRMRAAHEGAPAASV